MELWTILFISNHVVPIIMLLYGILFYKKVPIKINSVFGYRTRRSMKNQRTWKFANNFCGKIFIIVGSTTLLFAFGVMMLLTDNAENSICIIGLLVTLVEIGVLVFTFFSTELALIDKFDKYGNLKQ